MTYINVPTQDLLMLVKKLEERVLAHKETEKEKLIQERMTRWLFRNRTRSEAISSLNQDDLFSKWKLLPLRYYKIYETITRLRSLCYVAKASVVSYVALSSDDAEQLQRFK